jgi:hypothetical protein
VLTGRPLVGAAVAVGPRRRDGGAAAAAAADDDDAPALAGHNEVLAWRHFLPFSMAFDGSLCSVHD